MAQAGIEEITGVVRVEREDGWDGGIRLLVNPQPGRAILNDVSEQMRQKSLNFDEIYVELGRLDDVFHELTTQG